MESEEYRIISLEDFHEDIIGKAMRGLGIGKNEMACRLNVERCQIDFVLDGGSDEELIDAMAKILGLDGAKLIRSAKKQWSPAPIALSNLKQFNLPFGDMFVNAYVIWDEDNLNAWIFDTGPVAQPITDFLKEKNLQVDAIFLTHSHRDHIACLEELRATVGNPPFFIHELELLDNCQAIKAGFNYRCGPLILEAKHTHGHSTGGMTYVLQGLRQPLAVVGDAIFAGSMGGGMISYTEALQTNRENIMTLASETILCPGHGPMTTVEEEKENNPFFPEFP